MPFPHTIWQAADPPAALLRLTGDVDDVDVDVGGAETAFRSAAPTPPAAGEGGVVVDSAAAGGGNDVVAGRNSGCRVAEWIP